MSFPYLSCRQILREHGCLPTLLQHLKSHSLTIVSNACGTLWNLSARDAKDQETLWELGAVGMLRNLIHSRHKMIAMGSAAALRNLMANRPARYKDASVVSPGAGAPSLHARKQKALFEELDAQQLSETFDNIDNLSPKAAHRKGRGCNSAGGAAGTTRPYTNTPVLSSPKNADGSKRMSEEAGYARTVFSASVRASSDSLNSVTSADGYGNRGKNKPSSEPFYSSDENAANKCCVYRKYPADLAHKIRSANHMADDDGAELDTPINYSLKYSDEQLNSGRQSPSHRVGIDSEDEDDSRLRTRTDGGDPVSSSSRIISVPPPRYVVTAATSSYGGEPAGEQPIDYSLKYGSEGAHKPLFKAEDSVTSSVPTPAPSSSTKLRPPAPAGRAVAKANQESTQTYCVEDTPICFSRGSSLSSLSSEEEEEVDVIERRRAGGGSGGGNSDYPALPVSQKDAREQQQRHQKEAESQTAAVTAPSTRGRRSHHHHHHGHHHHHHHHVTSSSGARTPKSPPEPPYAQETPLMFSRCTSVSSLDSFSTSSIASSVRSSEPCSGMPSGVVSPSDLPDSPGQTMPPSRAKTPPLPPAAQKAKEQENGKKKDVDESSADVLLHFATESTPHGFSRASSLSALSVDEPFIAAELKKEEEEEDKGSEQRVQEAPKPVLDESDDDDDIEILEACINMAMPKSSRKPKKPQQAAPRKASQLPVYKLRVQAQPRKEVPPPAAEEVPRIYCVEGTPLNFSTATSLSDLTIDSPPNEEATAAVLPAGPAAAAAQESRTGPPEGENGDDILAECISAAMPKAKPRKPLRMAVNSEHVQSPPLAPPLPPAAGAPLGQQAQKKKPTSPVKPMPQRVAYNVTATTAAKTKPGFAFDSPRHYTPIEGTPCCFSRNDSLSSLDFDEDDGGDKDEEQKKAKEEDGKKRKQQTAAVFPRTKATATSSDEKQKFAIEDTPVCFSRNSSLSSLSDIDQENNNKEFAPPPPAEPRDGGKAGEQSPPPLQAEAKPRPPVASGYAPKAFHVEDTPVCFSRNSSLSSLSIDSEDDLLQECISSAMPKKKKKAAATTAPTALSAPLPVPEAENGALAEEELPSEAPRSPASPDSESFDWKAIQEGANSIVSSLNAAAAASLSRQPSSDSDSVLSLKSVGSPFHLPSANNNAEEDKMEQAEEAPAKRGARILKAGERTTLDAKKEKEEEEEDSKGVRGGKKVYRSLITGKVRAEAAARGRSKPRAAAMAKAPGSSDPAEHGSGSSRDSTPSRSSTANGQKGGKLSQLPCAASPGSASSSAASRAAKQSGTSKGGSAGGTNGLPRSESASRVGGSTAAKKQRVEPDKPALVRQSTFIKEAPSPTLKRKLEESAPAAPSESPTSPDAFLPSASRRHDASRSHSESPSRPQEVTSLRFSRTGTWKRENSSAGTGGGSAGKHSTSLPRVGTWKRTGSSSSVLSASSESSEKGRSEEDSSVRSKGTWRKTKSGGGEAAAGRGGSNKSEDVWVRLEDCPVNNPRSSSSCSARSPTSANAPPVIDSLTPSKIPSSSSSSSSNLNLRRSYESLDEKPPPERQQQQQQRSQPRSGAVAARVSPFNYTPSPRKSSADAPPTPTPTTTAAPSSSSATPPRPSLIPTPVTKKREPKGGEGGAGGGGAGGERGSYIVTSV